MLKKIDSIKIQRTIWAKLYFIGFLFVKILGALIAVAFVSWAFLDEVRSYVEEPKLLKTKYSSTLSDYKLPTFYLTAAFYQNVHVKAFGATVQQQKGNLGIHEIDCKYSRDDGITKTKEKIDFLCWKMNYNLADFGGIDDLTIMLGVRTTLVFHSKEDEKMYYDLRQSVISAISPALQLYFEYEGVDYQIGNSFMFKVGEAHDFLILEQIEVEDEYHGMHNVSMNTKFYPVGGGGNSMTVHTDDDSGVFVESFTIIHAAFGSFQRVYSKYGRSTGSMILSGIGAKFSTAKMISGIILLMVNLLLFKGYIDNMTYKQARIHKKVLRYLNKVSKNPKAAHGEVDRNLHDLLISET